MKVSKFGQRTLLTEGELQPGVAPSGARITTTNPKGLHWSAVMRITPADPSKPFALAGDSGSVVWDEQRNAVAMVVGGTAKQALAVPLTAIYKDLGVAPLST
jgi:hypothetical protein